MTVDQIIIRWKSFSNTNSTSLSTIYRFNKSVYWTNKKKLNVHSFSWIIVDQLVSTGIILFSSLLYFIGLFSKISTGIDPSNRWCTAGLHEFNGYDLFHVFINAKGKYTLFYEIQWWWPRNFIQIKWCAWVAIFAGELITPSQFDFSNNNLIV